MGGGWGATINLLWGPDLRGLPGQRAEGSTSHIAARALNLLPQLPQPLSPGSLFSDPLQGTRLLVSSWVLTASA